MKYLKTFEQKFSIDREIQKISTPSSTSVNKQDSSKVPSMKDCGGRIYTFQSFDKPVNKDLIPILRKARLEAIKHYNDWFDKPETQKKFKDKDNIKILRDLLNNTKVILLRRPKEQWEKAAAYVIPPQHLKIDPDRLLGKFGRWLRRTLADEDIESWENIWYCDETLNVSLLQAKKTIIHEIGHLVDGKLSSLGEKSLAEYNFILPNTGQEAENSGTFDEESYVGEPTENYARLQGLRETLNLEPNETAKRIIDKLYKKIQDKEIGIRFDMEFTISKSFDGKKLILSPTGKKPINLQPNMAKKELLKYITFFINPTKNRKIEERIFWDCSYLFLNFSYIKDGKIYIDFERIANLNNSVVKTDSKDSIVSKTV